MKKLKVSLPAIERALKSHVSTNITRQKQDDDKKQTKKKTTKSSKERVRKYREKLKNDPVYKQKLLELKEKKKTENKAYKSKQKLKRENDENFDRECKVKQRKWTKDSRKRKSKTLNIETANTNGQVRYSCKKKVDQHSTLRKRAERVRKSLPEDSNYWAKTMSHIIKHATPKRRSLLNLSTSSPGTENLLETLELRRQGRPNKEQAGAKKKLAFSEKSTSLWNSKKSLNEYKRRKNKQAKRLSKTTQFKKSWMPKLLRFLDEHSRTMPNKKDTILIDGRHVAKRHLLCTKLELFKSFKAIHPDYSRRFSTFKKMIPKNFKRLDVTCRRVCVCTKDFNFEQKVEALNKIAQQSMPLLKATPKQLSNLSLCPYEDIPKRSCVDRQCVDCGTAIVVNTYEPLVQACGNSVVAKYYQWESSKESYISKDGDKKHTTRWIQAEKTCSVADLVHDIAKSLESHSSHLFRANFQYKMESLLTSDLPLDHCLVVMDFSENISLQPQDEIESAHWTTKQVTLHPVFIVRHDPQSTIENPVIVKESIVFLSDYLAHNADVVYTFTTQLIGHLAKNPGPCPLKVIHRFTDNCAAQYKCSKAFNHITLLQETFDIKVIYHFMESGHGKGQSDGIGAGIKRKLERLILGGKVINNAYQVYLALSQNPNEKINQKIIFMPYKKIKISVPMIKQTLKSLKGTHSFHMISQHHPSTDVLTCYDLSCICVVCTGGQQGPCLYSQYRKNPKHFSLATASNTNHCERETNLRGVLTESIESYNNSTEHINETLSEFENKIRRKGWEIRGTTPDDGNCFFWAISDQLDALGMTEHTHTQLRSKVIHHMQNLSETDKLELEQFLTSDLTKYIEKMSKNGTYADHVCLQNMCKALSCKIDVVHGDTPNISIGDGDSNIPTLVVGYIPEIEHYVSLQRLNRFNPEDFVAVALKSNRKTYLYIAKVISQADDDIQVRFLKASGGADEYSWPAKEDVSWQSLEDIVQKLKMPILLPGRGIRLKFNLNDLKSKKSYIFK